MLRILQYMMCVMYENVECDLYLNLLLGRSRREPGDICSHLAYNNGSLQRIISSYNHSYASCASRGLDEHRVISWDQKETICDHSTKQSWTGAIV